MQAPRRRLGAASPGPAACYWKEPDSPSLEKSGFGGWTCGLEHLSFKTRPPCSRKFSVNNSQGAPHHPGRALLGLPEQRVRDPNTTQAPRLWSRQLQGSGLPQPLPLPSCCVWVCVDLISPCIPCRWNQAVYSHLCLVSCFTCSYPKGGERQFLLKREKLAFLLPVTTRPNKQRQGLNLHGPRSQKTVGLAPNRPSYISL